MDTFVIGASGFVGGNVARHLAAASHTVRGLARNASAGDQLRTAGSRL